MGRDVKSRGTAVLEGAQTCCACLVTLDEGEEVAFLLYVDEETLRRRRFWAHLGACEARLYGVERAVASESVS